jgi:hypothetical protein
MIAIRVASRTQSKHVNTTRMAQDHHVKAKPKRPSAQKLANQITLSIIKPIKHSVTMKKTV